MRFADNYKIKSYAREYVLATGESIPPDYDIHHVDWNHNNNAIENLVAIPKNIHKEWHKRMIERKKYELANNTHGINFCDGILKKLNNVVAEHIIKRDVLLEKNKVHYEAKKPR